jgi:hypothetical protein
VKARGAPRCALRRGAGGVGGMGSAEAGTCPALSVPDLARVGVRSRMARGRLAAAAKAGQARR